MYVIMGLLEFCFNIWIFDYGVINFFFINIYMYFYFNYVYVVLLDLYVNSLLFKKKYLVIL